MSGSESRGPRRGAFPVDAPPLPAFRHEMSEVPDALRRDVEIRLRRALTERQANRLTGRWNTYAHYLHWLGSRAERQDLNEDFIRGFDERMAFLFRHVWDHHSLVRREHEGTSEYSLHAGRLASVWFGLEGLEEWVHSHRPPSGRRGRRREPPHSTTAIAAGFAQTFIVSHDDYLRANPNLLRLRSKEAAFAVAATFAELLGTKVEPTAIKVAYHEGRIFRAFPWV